ncbi:MAG: aldo/keto reductase [Planctomycetales bacterium]|nr:aldo/keto reductase [Planctomycetales bacterium]
MERVKFGRTGLFVSPVAFGTWQLSPRFWGTFAKSDALSAMGSAYEAGVNFFDTADAYGDGHAETVLGEFLGQIPRQDVVVATKWFNHFKPDGSRFPDLSPKHLAQRCEASLKRLGIETIDVCLLHFYDQLTPLEEVAQTLNKLQQEGKIRFYGVSNHNVEQLRAQRMFGDFDVAQPAYSFLDLAIENDLLPYCQAQNIGVMVYSPMHKGLLTGKYTGQESFEDFRANHPDFQSERFTQVCLAVQSLLPLAEKYGMSIYQLVLAATLMHPAIQVAICGFKNSAQVIEAAASMGKQIEREDYFQIRNTLSMGLGTKVVDAKGIRK